MDINTGRIREIPKGELRTKTEVLCPEDKRSQSIMGNWGANKRKRYSRLVKQEMYTPEKAFEIVEYHRGRI